MRKPPNPKTSKKSNPTQTPSFCLLSIPNMSKRTFQQLSDESADLSMPTRRMTRSNSSSNPNSFTYYPVVEDTSSRKKRRTQQSNTGSPSKQVLTSSKSKKQGYFPERLYSSILDQEHEGWVMWLDENVIALQNIYHLAQALNLKESSLRAELRKHKFVSVKAEDYDTDQLQKTINGIEPSIDVFTHPNFVRNDLDSVRSIKRQPKQKTKKTANNKALSLNDTPFVNINANLLMQKLQDELESRHAKFLHAVQSMVETKLQEHMERVDAKIEQFKEDRKPFNSPESDVLEMQSLHMTAKKESLDDLFNLENNPSMSAEFPFM
eukprot:TRINITY_DN2348_c0_g1_i1.p1 TRINITY_DN2348_c0_g1~~TRINITY_DN2348_c0_g1_i1.p1  ORF type:complete len:322 (+),score=119.45 TRINITY_DN2348_c0_g1_i1:276-1241(+)